MIMSRVGETFGPYLLRSRIGVGGMGEVYEAYDTATERVVALKVLRAEYAADRSFQERFRRESRTAAQLQEPHVIPVHRFGEIDGKLYIDMRLVEGRDLKKVLAQDGPMPPSRACAIVAQVAAALDAAHTAGLIHRDVKPENVLLTKDDFAYLADFGIARHEGDNSLTLAGSAIGSCAYMAPERFTGGEVGPPADVYSLSCLLFECLTGRPPFPSGDITKLMSAHIMSPRPRPSALEPDLDPAFDNVIAWGMAQDPSRRCQSAGALARAAESAAAGRGSRTLIDTPRAVSPGYAQREQRVSRPDGPPYGMFMAAAALGIALTVAVVTAVWLAVDRNTGAVAPGALSPDIPKPQRTVTVPRDTSSQTTNVPAPTRSPSIAFPGTDALGFIAYPAARCDPGDALAALGLTRDSALVVCRYALGDSYYYRGLRLRDGASIHLDNATAAEGGFDVVNPVDGTLYRVRPYALSIITPDDEVFTEPMTRYGA